VVVSHRFSSTRPLGRASPQRSWTATGASRLRFGVVVPPTLSVVSLISRPSDHATMPNYGLACTADHGWRDCQRRLADEWWRILAVCTVPYVEPQTGFREHRNSGSVHLLKFVEELGLVFGRKSGSSRLVDPSACLPCEGAHASNARCSLDGAVRGQERENCCLPGSLTV
jgi:hypothetical protein